MPISTLAMIVVVAAGVVGMAPGARPASAQENIPPRPASLNCNTFEAAYHPGVKQWYCVTTKPSARARSVARRQRERREAETNDNAQAALQSQLQQILRRAQEIDRQLQDAKRRAKETLRPRQDLKR